MTRRSAFARRSWSDGTSLAPARGNTMNTMRLRSLVSSRAQYLAVGICLTFVSPRAALASDSDQDHARPVATNVTDSQHDSDSGDGSKNSDRTKRKKKLKDDGSKNATQKAKHPGLTIGDSISIDVTGRIE